MMSEAALAHIAAAEQKAAEVDGMGPDVPTRPIATVGIIGAGSMGGGIAMNFLNVGLPVTIVEREQAALDRG
ncbi:MAG: 3-hydroxyacyl-CoA dehydrogenase NAD-binding domain-containing protein, partial [Sandaracinobacteroides sp.]